MKSETLINFGNRVRELRLQAGYSQEELADRCGLHRTYIGMIERAEKNITILNMEKIADALTVSLSMLVRDIHSGQRRITE